jgi:hypothetical protein
MVLEALLGAIRAMLLTATLIQAVLMAVRQINLRCTAIELGSWKNFNHGFHGFSRIKIDETITEVFPFNAKN